MLTWPTKREVECRALQCITLVGNVRLPAQTVLRLAFSNFTHRKETDYTRWIDMSTLQWAVVSCARRIGGRTKASKRVLRRTNFLELVLRSSGATSGRCSGVSTTQRLMISPRDVLLGESNEELSAEVVTIQQRLSELEMVFVHVC